MKIESIFSHREIRKTTNAGKNVGGEKSLYHCSLGCKQQSLWKTVHSSQKASHLGVYLNKMKSAYKTDPEYSCLVLNYSQCPVSRHMCWRLNSGILLSLNEVSLCNCGWSQTQRFMFLFCC